MWLQAFVTIAVAYVVKKTVDYRRAVRSVGNLPGYRTVISGTSVLSNFIPKILGICPGRNFPFEDKYSMYAWAGLDIVAHAGAFHSQAAFFVADPAAVKEITTYRSRFPKPVDLYNVLSFFGYNIIASEGEDWKRYRKISAPAFSDRNNKLVWDETVSIMNDLFDNSWENKEEVTIDHCLDLTLPITLFVISAAGFGYKLSWKGGHTVPKGHKMTFKDSLYTVATYIVPRLILPDWAMLVSKKTREIALGFKELKMHMTEMIETRLKSEKVERDDLFSSLLDANRDELEGGLTMDELVGNIFIFLLAGHETTAHTLCFTLGLLALYPDGQEKLFQHIKSTIPNTHAPTYEQMPLLTQTMAYVSTIPYLTLLSSQPICSVFYETLRLFPSVRCEPVVVPIPQGIDVHINVPALQCNPKYWEDPLEFKPDRFLKPDWNRDAFIPFSSGPRACLGRKFAETEAVVMLTMLVSRYKITVKDEPKFRNETFEQKKARVLKSIDLLTLTPVRVPLTFTRR
ncbi:Secologanin synthase [Leucoagaricus sp. SymC.cos]|nr:Secologanin synthase [Leucoagaricus sp. SymC.cos]